MRIIFIGSVEFSRATLTYLLLLKAEIVGVCTLQKSSFNADHADLSSICEERDIPWLYAEDINSEDSLDWIRQKKPDIIFCFGWSRLLKDPLLTLAPLGVLGYHPAALPKNRGRHPLIWALVLGLQETASTFFFMDSGADSGDILSQCSVAIALEDNAETLYQKITAAALSQIHDFLPLLKTNNFIRHKQDHHLSNIWRKRGMKDGEIDWRMSAQSIHNLVRALAKPYVGAHFFLNGNQFRVWSTLISEDPEQSNIEPGKVLRHIESKPLIKCGLGSLLLMDTEPALTVGVGSYIL